MKYISIICLCLVFSLALSGPISAAESPANNTSSTATYRTIPSSYSTSAFAIDYVGDLDWYYFYSPSAGTITITSSGTTDVKGYLYSSSSLPNTTINNPDSDDDANGNRQFKISVPVTVGYYYLRVQYYDNTKIGAYGLTFSHQAAVATNQPPKFLSGPYLTFNSDGSARVYWDMDDPERRSVTAVASIVNQSGVQISSTTKTLSSVATAAYNQSASFASSELGSLLAGQSYKALVTLTDTPPSGARAQSISFYTGSSLYPVVFIPASLTSPSSGSSVTAGQSTYFAWNRGSADQVDIKLSTSYYGGTDAGSTTFYSSTSWTTTLPSVSASTLYVQLTSWKSGQSKTTTATFSFRRPVSTYELTPTSRTVTAYPGDTIKVKGGFYKDANNTQYWAEPVIVKRSFNNGEQNAHLNFYPTTASPLVETLASSVYVAGNYYTGATMNYFAHFLSIYPPALSSTLSVSSSAETWLLIHGRSDTTLGILGNDWMDMALNLRRVLNTYPKPNVFRINWSTIAAREGIDVNMPYFPKLAEALNRGLNSIGALGTKNIVGHSWGTYLGYEYASRFGPGATATQSGKIGWFIALDPARTAFGYSESKINFGKCSMNSWAIIGTNEGLEWPYVSFSGETLAWTAQEAFLLTSSASGYYLTGNPYTAHSAPRIFFARCLSGYLATKSQSTSIYNYFTPTQAHSGTQPDRWNLFRQTAGYNLKFEGYVEFAYNSNGSSPQKLVRKNSSNVDIPLMTP